MEINPVLYKTLSENLRHKSNEVIDRYSRRMAVFSESPETLGIGEIYLKSILWDFLDDAISAGVTTLFTSLSYGADSAAAELFTERKQEGADVRIVHIPASKDWRKDMDPAVQGFAANSFSVGFDYSKQISGAAAENDRRIRDRFIIDQCLHITFVLDLSDDTEHSYIWNLFDYAASTHSNAITHNIHLLDCRIPGTPLKTDETAGQPFQAPLF